MNKNKKIMPDTVFFQDTEGSWWETCDADTPNAEAFGPRGCAVRATPPEWLSAPKMQGDWIVYQAYFRFPCIGCKKELFSQPGEFCSTCETNGTERSIRLSDEVDNFAKYGNNNVFYPEDEWNEFK